MAEISEERRSSATPVSVCVSDDTIDDDLPSTLEAEELQLALNKEATESELSKAIARCKDLVLESDQCSIERRWLVRHLIELRLRLQECREALQDPLHPRNKSSGVSKRSVKGHHLKLQPLLKNTSSKYCDHCTGSIWCVVQAWYECEDCGYSCHHKCISSINRDCAHVVASERGEYEYEICPEVGLSAQRYQCVECKCTLPLSKEWSEARRCDYDGLYYCSACHWNSSAIVPARVIHNWDLTPQLVSQASFQQLRVTANRPMMNLESLNPRLFTLVQELSLVRRLRHELHGMRKYLLVCRQANEDHLLWKNVETPHLIENPDMYSLEDLVNTKSGELPGILQTLIDTFTKHIKVSCEICRGRGHICEICSNVEILYPFDSTAFVCKNCKAVFHRTCFNRKIECPKCKRLKIRELQQKSEDCEEE